MYHQVLCKKIILLFLQFGQVLISLKECFQALTLKLGEEANGVIISTLGQLPPS